MKRRTFIAASAGAAISLAKSAGFTMDRIAFITDEASASPKDAIAFAQKYGLKWVELREVPGAKKAYSSLSPADLKIAAAELRDAGLKVSFFNSGGTKFALPGTQPVRAPDGWEAKSQAQHGKLIENLKREIAAAQVFGAKNVRVFAFGRVAQPESIFPRLAEELGRMGEVARKEGVLLLLENEGACNVATCAEMAGLIKLLPESSFGLNWDANNGQTAKERPYPEGYSLLPKKRIVNVHMHGRTLLDPEKMLDWKTIFGALVKDGYRGCAGLETHYFDGTKIEKSHLSMLELQKILSARS